MIYFVVAPNSRSVKIGYTGGDPEKRLAQLQTGCPERLALLGAVDGGVDRERELHQRFALQRLTGEWFRMDDALAREIDVILKPYPVFRGRVIRSVYLAGKITGTTWRDEIAPGYSLPPLEGGFASAINHWCNWAPARSAVPVPGFHALDYAGPFWASGMDDPALGFRSVGKHACGVECDAGDTFTSHDPLDFPCVTERDEHGSPTRGVVLGTESLASEIMCAVESTDLVFLWLDRHGCYGSVAEVGLARGMNKLVFVATKAGFDCSEEWLAVRLAHSHVAAASPAAAWAELWSNPEFREDRSF